MGLQPTGSRIARLERACLAGSDGFGYGCSNARQSTGREGKRIRFRPPAAYWFRWEVRLSRAMSSRPNRIRSAAPACGADEGLFAEIGVATVRRPGDQASLVRAVTAKAEASA